MNTQPTPITDCIVRLFRAGEAHSDGLILTMVDLENQLTAALAEIDRLDVAGIHTCHSECQKSNCVLRRELTAVTAQRDRLAESLANLVKANETWNQGMMDVIGRPPNWNDSYLNEAKSALQSLTPKSQ
jgi:hypothetical protein